MDKQRPKINEKDPLTWDDLQKHLEEFNNDKKHDSEYISLMMETLKKKYSLPCKDKSTNKSDKIRGYYGC